MENCICIGKLLQEINWWAYIGSVVTVFIIGAFWFSFLFKKMWIETNKIDLNITGSTGNMVFTMVFQLLTTALLGVAIFLLTKVSIDLTIVMIIAVSGWMKSNLKFKFVDFRTFYKAAIAEVGYFAISSIVFLLFSLI